MRCRAQHFDQHEIKLANLARTHQLGGDFRARGRSALCLGCSSHDGEGGHDGQDGEGRERTASAVPAAAATRGDAMHGGRRTSTAVARRAAIVTVATDTFYRAGSLVECRW